MLNQITPIFRKIPLLSGLVHLVERSLKKANTQPFANQADTLAEIDLNHLMTTRIGGIILDLDNTIVSEDDRYISPEAVDWIKRAKSLGLKLFILSNGKRRYRVEYWSNYLEVPAINPAKKPFPTAFRKALQHMELQPEQVVVIGDSRHTDVLGAWIVGCPCIQVASLPHPPRWWETLLGKYVQTPYPMERSLWNFQPSAHYRNP
ncbi:YqeG family HAD IIIA-type phosphatase [Leptolyngbya sp. AN02str]|uniref:YqeG family HAD IIIA-type phosphatase n=1 Tax=Leptolyngbya sp. AN02str TaxID=3423363 RepID=UPI003D311E43